MLKLYSEKLTSQYGGIIQISYLERVKNRDLTLKNDQKFLDLLYDAADDIDMQDVQWQVATEIYWLPVLEDAEKFNIRLALSYCYMFDASVRLGPANQNLEHASDDLAHTTQDPMVLPGDSDWEKLLIRRAIKRARDEMYVQAARENLPGLKVRANFWTEMSSEMGENDWDMTGDGGYIHVKDGPSGKVNALTPIARSM